MRETEDAERERMRVLGKSTVRPVSGSTRRETAEADSPLSRPETVSPESRVRVCPCHSSLTTAEGSRRLRRRSSGA